MLSNVCFIQDNKKGMSKGGRESDMQDDMISLLHKVEN